jgi:hypothetical protein
MSRRVLRASLACQFMQISSAGNSRSKAAQRSTKARSMMFLGSGTLSTSICSSQLASACIATTHQQQVGSMHCCAWLRHSSVTLQLPDGTFVVFPALKPCCCRHSLQGFEESKVGSNSDQHACDAAAAQLQQLCLEAACRKVSCSISASVAAEVIVTAHTSC